MRNIVEDVLGKERTKTFWTVNRQRWKDVIHQMRCSLRHSPVDADNHRCIAWGPG